MLQAAKAAFRLISQYKGAKLLTEDGQEITSEADLERILEPTGEASLELYAEGTTKEEVTAKLDHLWKMLEELEVTPTRGAQ